MLRELHLRDLEMGIDSRIRELLARSIERVTDNACYTIIRLLQNVDFFFSSRRWHTRWPRDWSSDVCSSDLTLTPAGSQARRSRPARLAECCGAVSVRSEERRVGKEGRSRWSPYHEKKKKGGVSRESAAVADAHTEAGATGSALEE